LYFISVKVFKVQVKNKVHKVRTLQLWLAWGVRSPQTLNITDLRPKFWPEYGWGTEKGLSSSYK